MLQFTAAIFFAAALIVPLGLIALTIQNGGGAILSALRGTNDLRRRAVPAARFRTRSQRGPAPDRRPMRAAA